MLNLLKKILQWLIPVAVVLTAWQITALGVGIFRGVSFPGPWQTGARFFSLVSGELLSSVSLYAHTMDSLKRWLAGFSIAAVSGIGYGLAAGRIEWLEKATGKIPQVFLLIPGLAWIPVAILLFGIGEPATVFMIAVSGFAPIAVNTLSGIKNIDIRFIRAAAMMGARQNTLFLNVLIPGALPSILSGLRIGLGTGWRVLVAAEMIVGTGTGLGYSIIQARWTLDYASSFVCIVMICVIGLLFEHLFLKQIEKQTIRRWALVQEKQ